MIRARFANYVNPVIAALRELGGSGRPAEVCDTVARDLEVSDDQIEEMNQSGQSRFKNDVAWARYYLSAEGYLDSSKRGVWSLTEKGQASEPLSDEEINALVRKVQAADAKRRAKAANESTGENTPPHADEIVEPESAPDSAGNYREDLIGVLRSLPPEGFERICQRLLREAGFENVEVTGRSGDGGIDGIGILALNPFVSFKVLFQCKRFSGSVGPSVIRDFRGAMQGRTDKGIVLTTGTFTTEARRESVRDGAPPIELVDGESLVQMFEQYELGLNPRTTFDLNRSFFREFEQ